jgi:hypothetical protein
MMMIVRMMVLIIMVVMMMSATAVMIRVLTMKKGDNDGCRVNVANDNDYDDKEDDNGKY